MPERFDAGRLLAFLGGLAAIGLALSFPVDALARSRLPAHMVQHVLLMLVAPPLLWRGLPVAPLLVALPWRLRHAVAVVLGAPPVRRLTGWLARPALAWAS